MTIFEPYRIDTPQALSWLEFNVHFQYKYGYIRDDTPQPITKNLSKMITSATSAAVPNMVRPDMSPTLGARNCYKPPSPANPIYYSVWAPDPMEINDSTRIYKEKKNSFIQLRSIRTITSACELRTSCLSEDQQQTLLTNQKRLQSTYRPAYRGGGSWPRRCLRSRPIKALSRTIRPCSSEKSLRNPLAGYKDDDKNTCACCSKCQAQGGNDGHYCLVTYTIT